MAPVDSRDYVLSRIHYSISVRNTCQESQQTRRWPNDGPPLRRWPSIKPAMLQRLVFPGSCIQPSKHKTFVQCWANVEAVGLTLYKCYTNVLCLLGIAAGLELLNTAGNVYKPTPTQCLLNVGPASPVLASIHSVLVSNFMLRYLHVFFSDFIYTFTVQYTVQYIQYTVQNKREQDNT